MPSLRIPDLTPLLEAGPAIQIHVLAAVAAFVLGLLQFAAPKGVGIHRVMGWIWVGLMLITAVSSFFIRTINPGAFSLIHLLSGWTVIGAPMIIWLARRQEIRRHRLSAYAMFLGGLVVAGAFTFLPGRLMWDVFFG